MARIFRGVFQRWRILYDNRRDSVADILVSPMGHWHDHMSSNVVLLPTEIIAV